MARTIAAANQMGALLISTEVPLLVDRSVVCDTVTTPLLASRFSTARQAVVRNYETCYPRTL